MNIDAVVEAYWDREWDRQCDEEEIERKAEELGLTYEQYVAQLKKENDEAKIDLYLANQD